MDAKDSGLDARLLGPVSLQFKKTLRGTIRGCGRVAPRLVLASTALLRPLPRLRVFVAQCAEFPDAVMGSEFQVSRGPLTASRFTGLLTDEIGPILANTMELRCSQIIAALPKSDGVMFDIGGSYGYYALLMSRVVGPSGRVYSFEPDWRSFSRLCSNIKLNSLSNTVPLPLCISDENRLSTWSSSRDQPWTSHMVETPLDTATLSIVPVCTLDDVASTLGITRPVVLIKIDVEGHEANVLRGAREVIRKSRPLIICELHGTKEASDVFAILRDEGYGWEVVEYIDESRQHICASSNMKKA